MKLTLRLIGLAGTLLFGAVVVVTSLSPIQVERAARGFVESRIEDQLREALGIAGAGIEAGQVGALAEALRVRHGEEARQLQAMPDAGLEAQVAAVVGQMQDLDCACRAAVIDGLVAATETRLSRLERAQPQLGRIIEARYVETISDLLRDLRLFAGANLLAFLLLLGLSLARPGQVRALFVPALLLAVAALTASAFYLVGQDWFATFLYGDYVGPAYVLWLVLVFALLCDVALFKARVTSRVAGALAIPC